MCTICTATATFDPARHATGAEVFANLTEIGDAAADTSTAYTIQLGDTFSGTLSYNGDRDWIAITLQAGQSYEIDLAGSSLSDPYLRLYNDNGYQLVYNDDGGPGLDSRIVYTPDTTGTYYIAAGAYNDSGTGTYQVSVSLNTPAPAGSLDDLADYLTDGFWNDQGATRHSFDTSTDNTITVNLTALTAEGRQLARWALEAWEMVADIEFVEVTGSADITFDDDQPGAYSNSVTSGTTIVSSTVNVSSDWIDTYGATIDSYSFSTYIHEIGHALGLGHQGPYNGNAVYGQDEAYANDSWQLSVMSYFSQSDNTSTNASQAAILTAMMADVIAIQNLYGAPVGGSATTGNTTWGANSDLGGYLGAYFASLTGGGANGVYGGDPVAYTIYDRDGTDTLDVSYSNSGDTVRLRPAQFSDVGGLTGNIAIARGTFIENAITGGGNDRVESNNLSNYIATGNGNDTVLAEGGWDTVYGGAGNDDISGGNGNDTLEGGPGYDRLWGGDHDDRIDGGGWADTIGGGDGNDYIIGNAGNDQLWGAGGNDTLIGGLHADTMGGGNGDDMIWGDDGYDQMMGGNGNDTMGGGAQNDTMDGGAGNDLMWGGADNDRMFGGSGNDTIYGGSGDDMIWAGWGNDQIIGGLGADSFIFGSGIGNDTIADFDISESDVLRLNDSLWAGDGNLTTAEVIDRYAEVEANGDVVFTFDGGEVITLSGLGGTAGLAGAMEIF